MNYNNEAKYIIKHPKNSNEWAFRHTTSDRASISKNGITYDELKNTLNNFVPNGSKSCENSQINIWDRELEEYWLKRCLIPDENIDEWNIIYIAEMIELNGEKSKWTKELIKNRKTGRYSFRSSWNYDINDSYYNGENRVRKFTHNNLWLVEWTPLTADEQFWVDLKIIFNL